MTPEEAIKELNSLRSYPHEPQTHTSYKALSLGIEALKFRQRWEQQEGENDFPLLPGETEE